MASSSSSSSSFPTHDGSGAFKAYPQKYPKARQKAQSAIGALHALIQKAPHSQVAVVVDASYHVSQGYVVCTTNHVIVRVYGVPYGTVLPGMRVYVRRLGSLVTNQPYLFDGYAPNLSGQGLTGSLLTTLVPTSSTTLCASGGFSATACSSSLTTAVGYYWHCFFYLPVVPTSTITLFQMLAISGGNTVQLEYLPSGFLQFRAQDNTGYITSSTISPHNAHWVQIQPGLSSNEFLVDTVSNYAALGAGSPPTFSGGANTYAIALLSSNTGANPAPVGAWLSKFGYGANYTSGSVVPLSNSIPTYDSSLVNLSASSTQRTQSLYLCEDSLPTTTLGNSGQYGSSGNLTIATSYASVQVPGPY